MVASGSADGTVQVWRSADGVLLYTLSGYIDPVTAITWASDRRNVIASAGNNDGSVQTWDALRNHQNLIFHGEGRVLALDWKYQSPWIVSGGTDQEIYTWNATSGVRGAGYRGHKGNVNALLWLFRPAAFTAGRTPAMLTPTPSPIRFQAWLDVPNTIASAGADGQVHLWDARTGQVVRIYREHDAAVNGLTLVPNSDPSSLTLASASDDGSVHVWRAVVGDELLLTQGIGISDKKIYNGHRGQKVNAVTALFDLPHIPQYSGLLASAGDDETVQIWSAYQYYQPVFIYTGHRAPVKTLAFSPSSADSRLVSGDADGQVHLWTLELP
jgi:WD40 repeat protein